MHSFRLRALSVSNLASAFTVLGLLSSCTSLACDESLVTKAIQDGDPQLGFELLKECESHESVSPDALVLLAFFYQDDEFNGEGDRRDRLLRAWNLVERAALMGNEDAIDTLATMYSVGDEELGFGPDEEIADCLLKSADSHEDEVSPEVHASGTVRACLTTP